RVRLVEVDAPHGYDQEMRQAAYAWLARWLKQEGDGSSIPEAACELIPPPYQAVPQNPRHSNLVAESNPGWCFPSGRGPLPGPAITQMTQQMAETLPPLRTLPAGADEWASQRVELL